MVSPVNFKSEEDIDFGSCKKITKEAHERNRKKTDIRPNDIILHRIGAGLGKVRLVTKNMPEFSILHSLAMLRPDTQKISSYYMKWAFRSSYLQKQINNGIQSMGVPDLGLNKIANLVFAVPNLSEQSYIALTFENLQTKIDIENMITLKLTFLKKGLMQQLLTGKIRVKV
jgi:type I restriction enzyme S subunit